ncbi:MAG: hypothetical protein EBU23_08980 [Mycobacteriaceae bacterium]|nr:hypothetical protein [Mycobacteriaceae bacterium]
MSAPHLPLLPLVQELRNCPSRDTRLTAQSLRDAWDQFKANGWTPGAYPPIAVLAALVLHDDGVAALLTTEEHGQLLALGESALTRYRERTQPPNHLGKLLAATIRDNP